MAVWASFDPNLAAQAKKKGQMSDLGQKGNNAVNKCIWPVMTLPFYREWHLSDLDNDGQAASQSESAVLAINIYCSTSLLH